MERGTSDWNEIRPEFGMFRIWCSAAQSSCAYFAAEFSSFIPRLLLRGLRLPELVTQLPTERTTF